MICQDLTLIILQTVFWISEAFFWKQSFLLLLEAQSDAPSKLPLILWVNGQPSCSALQALTSIGPFLVNPDGKTAFENVYAWNKVANLLFIDSIPEVGFSYRDSSSQAAKITDDSIANDAVEALQKFVQAFPEYKVRDLYLAGVSNAGVYIH
uniref:Uncharacterized protein n=1 Tax=Ditylenchus dipsaci TaxID=166011 RepID=A0A915EN25_9BILA